MTKILGKSFFNRSTLVVARELIGSYLCRSVDGNIERYLVTETEAYDGPKDLASHASLGRRTKRTEIMYREAGTIYVYFTYGMHWMLNIITGPIDYPAGILIRGIEGTTGPGRVTKKLKVTGIFHGQRLGKEIGLWIEKGVSVPPKEIKRTPRIGVDFAGPIWSQKKYRFVWKSV